MSYACLWILLLSCAIGGVFAENKTETILDKTIADAKKKAALYCDPNEFHLLTEKFQEARNNCNHAIAKLGGEIQKIKVEKRKMESNLNKEIRTEKEKYSKLESKLNRTLLHVDELNKEIELLRAQLKNRTAEVKDLIVDKNELLLQIKNSVSVMESASNETKQLRKSLDGKTKELADEKLKLDVCINANKTAQQNNLSLQSKILQLLAELQKLQSSNEALTSANADISKDLSLAKSELNKCFKQVSENAAKVNSRNATDVDIHDLLKQFDDLRSEGWSLKSRLNINVAHSEWIISQVENAIKSKLGNNTGDLSQAALEDELNKLKEVLLVLRKDLAASNANLVNSTSKTLEILRKKLQNATNADLINLYLTPRQTLYLLYDVLELSEQLDTGLKLNYNYATDIQDILRQVADSSNDTKTISKLQELYESIPQAVDANVNNIKDLQLRLRTEISDIDSVLRVLGENKSGNSTIEKLLQRLQTQHSNEQLATTLHEDCSKKLIELYGNKYLEHIFNPIPPTCVPNLSLSNINKNFEELKKLKEDYSELEQQWIASVRLNEAFVNETKQIILLATGRLDNKDLKNIEEHVNKVLSSVPDLKEAKRAVEVNLRDRFGDILQSLVEINDPINLYLSPNQTLLLIDMMNTLASQLHDRVQANKNIVSDIADLLNILNVEPSDERIIDAINALLQQLSDNIQPYKAASKNLQSQLTRESNQIKTVLSIIGNRNSTQNKIDQLLKLVRELENEVQSLRAENASCALELAKEIAFNDKLLSDNGNHSAGDNDTNQVKLQDTLKTVTDDLNKIKINGNLLEKALKDSWQKQEAVVKSVEDIVGADKIAGTFSNNMEWLRGAQNELVYFIQRSVEKLDNDLKTLSNKMRLANTPNVNLDRADIETLLIKFNATVAATQEQIGSNQNVTAAIAHILQNNSSDVDVKVILENILVNVQPLVKANEKLRTRLNATSAQLAAVKKALADSKFTEELEELLERLAGLSTANDTCHAQLIEENAKNDKLNDALNDLKKKLKSSNSVPPTPLETFLKSKLEVLVDKLEKQAELIHHVGSSPPENVKRHKQIVKSIVDYVQNVTGSSEVKKSIQILLNKLSDNDAPLKVIYEIYYTGLENIFKTSRNAFLQFLNNNIEIEPTHVNITEPEISKILNSLDLLINKVKTSVQRNKKHANESISNILDVLAKTNCSTAAPQLTKLLQTYLTNVEMLSNSNEDLQIDLINQQVTLRNLVNELQRLKYNISTTSNPTTDLTSKLSELQQVFVDAVSKAVATADVSPNKNDLDSWAAILEDALERHTNKCFENHNNSLENKVESVALPKSCAEALQRAGANASSGIYQVHLPESDLKPFFVYCLKDAAGGPAWTVIQRRRDNTTDFYRGWQEYKQGFGNLNDDFFVGLDKLNALTQSHVQELWIHLEDFENQSRYAYYDSFAVGDEDERYALNVLGAYNGTAGDSLRAQQGQKFSTKDKDNDNLVGTNCANIYVGAWWYNACQESNLNGFYYAGKMSKDQYGRGIVWDTWRGQYYSLKHVHMAIRPRKPYTISPAKTQATK